jgi:ribonuclease Z
MLKFRDLSGLRSFLLATALPLSVWAMGLTSADAGNDVQTGVAGPAGGNGVNPGEEIELSRDHVISVFPTVHTIPSVGYLVWERRNKLKEEYLGLPGDKIRDLRLSGVEVTREVRVPLVAYTGDTSPAGLDRYPPVFEAKVLITEMSFIRDKHRRDKIHKFGHMHLDDFIERQERFKNEVIIAAHFSTRYGP